MFRLTCTNLVDLSKIIEYFDRYSLKSDKIIDYVRFKKIYNYIKTRKILPWKGKVLKRVERLLIFLDKEQQTICLLIKKLKTIEKKLGRKKNIKNFPRTCDIDIIDFKGLKFQEKNLQVPHPSLSKRNFVLVPLFEIEKAWIYPKTNTTIDKLIKNLDIKSLRSIKIF